MVDGGKGRVEGRRNEGDRGREVERRTKYGRGEERGIGGRRTG